MKRKCEKVDNSCREEKMGCTGCANDKKLGTMIYAKYQIGEKVWVVDANTNHNQVDVYSDVINGIFLDEKGDIFYYLSDICDDIIENKLIPYEDTNRLIEEIIKADNEVNEINKKEDE